MQRDGLPSMSYNTATNRMNSAGWEYDLAGNMTRGQNADGVWQRYEYDAAGRLKFVRNDAGAGVLENSYGASRQRIFRNEPGGSGFTWYVWGGDSVLAEYTSTSWGGVFSWAKSYVYAGSRLLFTATNNGAGGELKEYHHPDRLGTRMVTDPAANTLYLQSTLPFGTQFDSETTGSSNRLFTSYDRSAGTGLDNAVNRTYSPGQGRFTTVDPIGMNSTSPVDPQTLNLYSYVRNSPTDFVDPSGLNLEAPIIIIFDPKAVYEDRGGWFGTYWDSYFGASNGGSVDGDTGRRGPDDGRTVSTSSAEHQKANPQQRDSCGVNPVTGQSGLETHPGYNPRGGRPGGLGNLRPGVGGAGGFKERTGGKHAGVDIVAPVGTPILANREGVVVAVQTGYNGGYGETVIILHVDGLYSQYSHLSAISVVIGPVAQGQVIGNAGRSGNVPTSQPPSEDHVHFEVFSGPLNKNFRPISSNRLDPAKYLNGQCKAVGAEGKALNGQ